MEITSWLPQPPIYSWQSYPAGHYDPLDSLKALFKQNRILYSTSKVAQKIFELTNISINETLSRTLITSATTLLALLSIFFFGGEILKGFSLAMIFGVIFGTYSSIYISNTVLVRLRVSQKTILRDEEKN